MRYAIRFFFDAGSGVCLWAGNDAARDRWDYAIEAASLSLPPELRTEAERLVQWYDSSVDWIDPSNPSPWDQSARERFAVVAQVFLGDLRAFLGPDYDIIDESGTNASL